MKLSDFKSEDELRKMKIADIKAHVREYNDHYAIRGYSGLKKDQLINMVLTAQDRLRNAVKAKKGVSFASPAKKGEEDKPRPVRKAAPAKKSLPNAQGKDFLVTSKFLTQGEWANSRNRWGRAPEFKKGTKAKGTVIDDKALYFWKDLPSTPYELDKDGLEDYYDPLEFEGEGVDKKLSEGEAKSILKDLKAPATDEMREAIVAYLNAPKELKKAYPFAGVYEGKPVVVDEGGTGRPPKFSLKYGVILPFISPKVNVKVRTKSSPRSYDLQARRYRFKIVGRMLKEQRRD